MSKLQILVSVLSLVISTSAFSNVQYQPEEEYNFSKTESFSCNFRGDILNADESISYDDSEDDESTKIKGVVSFDFKKSEMIFDVPNFQSTQKFEIFENDLADYVLEGVAIYYGIDLVDDVGASVKTATPEMFILMLPKNKLAQVRLPLTGNKELVGHCVP